MGLEVVGFRIGGLGDGGRRPVLEDCVCLGFKVQGLGFRLFWGLCKGNVASICEVGSLLWGVFRDRFPERSKKACWLAVNWV